MTDLGLCQSVKELSWMEPLRCPVSDFSVSPARLVPNAVSGSGVRAKVERRQSERCAKWEQRKLAYSAEPKQRHRKIRQSEGRAKKTAAPQCQAKTIEKSRKSVTSSKCVSTLSRCKDTPITLRLTNPPLKINVKTSNALAQHPRMGWISTVSHATAKAHTVPPTPQTIPTYRHPPA